MRTVTITGTRAIDSEPTGKLAEVFDAYLRPFADEDAHFHLGGAVGIDTAALQWLAEYSAVKLTVTVPCTIKDQPPVAVEVITRWTQRGRLTQVVELNAAQLDAPAYHARNRWMVDRSGLVIGFPRGKEPSSGTWFTVNYAAEQDKPTLVVPV